MVEGAFGLIFYNRGRAGAVFHVYDRLRLDRAPRRYTVGPGAMIEGLWEAGPYDLWVIGPNGFHRHFAGDAGRDGLILAVASATQDSRWALAFVNSGDADHRIEGAADPYDAGATSWTVVASPGGSTVAGANLFGQGWYDIAMQNGAGWVRRLAGRLETGAASISDPLMGGPARLTRT